MRWLGFPESHKQNLPQAPVEKPDAALSPAPSACRNQPRLGDLAFLWLSAFLLGKENQEDVLLVHAEPPTILKNFGF